MDVAPVDVPLVSGDHFDGIDQRRIEYGARVQVLRDLHRLAAHGNACKRCPRPGSHDTFRGCSQGYRPVLAVGGDIGLGRRLDCVPEPIGRRGAGRQGLARPCRS